MTEPGHLKPKAVLIVFAALALVFGAVCISVGAWPLIVGAVIAILLLPLVIWLDVVSALE